MEHTHPEPQARNAHHESHDDHEHQSDFSLPDRSVTFPPVSNGSSTDLVEGRPPHRKQNSLDPGALQERGRGEQMLTPGTGPGSKKRSGGKSRICGKCNQPLLGQFVRALGGTYHLECFTCSDCGKIVASKFFPVPEQPPDQYPLCETDYFRRLDLLCFSCGGALRGSYITALDRKYHIEHFTCSVCPTVFGAQDSYYEHEGNVYCHYHYSTQFAQRCNGCQTAILKQFVEIFRNGQNQHWHPECYMIHKYWNVRLHQGASAAEKQMSETEATLEMRRAVRDGEEKVEEKVLWIWRTLSSFEEKSATCISDMLLHVSNGAYMDGVMSAKRFITHVDLLFTAADDLDWVLLNKTEKGLSYSREAKLLCKKVVAFFQLLAESQETGVRRLGVTQELLSLVTGLAHYLKLLVRICLQGALKLERETGSGQGLNRFLEDIGKLDEWLENAYNRDSRGETDALIARSADSCAVCEKSVEDRCFRRQDRLIHVHCLNCSKCGRQLGEISSEARWSEALGQVLCDKHAGVVGSAEAGGFAEVSRLQQYVYLLRVAHARLLATLRTSGALPHTSDDPNLSDYDSSQGHRAESRLDPPLLRSNTRSKSYAGSSSIGREKSPGYEQTMSDIRRLRSTRMDKQLGNTDRKARTSRIIDAPHAMQTGSPDRGERRRTGTFQIIEDRDANGDPVSQLSFGNNEAMTLDDIPRLVQAQQTREQRPNASKYARQAMVPQEPKVKLVNGHNRDQSGTMDDRLMGGEVGKSKRYFSELTALEYFIVRHVAVLSMEPLLEGHFNQEQLLDLIETKRPTFWGKFGSAFKNDKNKPKGKKKGVFGVALEQLIERDYTESTDGVGPGALRIPAVVQDSVSAMRTMDMSVEGVFRKNGNIKRLNETREEIDKNGAMDFDLTKENPVQVAALLKKFLRDLPDPLLTYKLHKLWITSQKITDDDKRRRVLHLTCCLLPKAHRDTMEVLFAFLNWAASFSHVDEESGSKMDIHNLATVMAPNILNLGNQDVPVDDSFLGIEAVHSLIENNETMCEIPEDLSLILNDSTLHSSSADITTKEILKRYGERARVPSSTPAITTVTSDPSLGASQSSPASRSRDGSNRPNQGVTRVDTDPSQANAWSNESSVRHVNQPPGGREGGAVGGEAGFVGGREAGGSSGYATPQAPYQLRNDSVESHGSPNRGGSGRLNGARAVGVT